MKVLLVQEYPVLTTALKFTLLTKGFDLVTSNDTLHALSTINEIQPNIVIADITKAGGFNYVEEAKKKNMPVIVISENGREDDLQLAFDKGADDYVCLPLSLPELALRVSLLSSRTNAMA